MEVNCFELSLGRPITTWLNTSTSAMRSFIQKLLRINKGYSDKDLWDLDSTLSYYILPRLIGFKKVNVNSYPAKFKSIEAWHKVLDKMIWSFQYITDGRFLDKEESLEKMAKDSKKCQEGLDLFGKYFQDLWD